MSKELRLLLADESGQPQPASNRRQLRQRAPAPAAPSSPEARGSPAAAKRQQRQQAGQGGSKQQRQRGKDRGAPMDSVVVEGRKFCVGEDVFVLLDEEAEASLE